MSSTNDILTISPSGLSVGIGMVPRDTDEGLCVPQHYRGPSFATGTYDANTDVAVKGQLRTQLGSRYDTFYNYTPSKHSWLSTTYKSYEDIILSNTDTYDGQYGGIGRTTTGNTWNDHLNQGYYSSSAGSECCNTGELTYCGKLLPYNSVSGFENRSLIPTLHHMQRYDGVWNTGRINMLNDDEEVWHCMKFGDKWMNTRTKTYTSTTATNQFTLDADTPVGSVYYVQYTTTTGVAKETYGMLYLTDDEPIIHIIGGSTTSAKITITVITSEPMEDIANASY